MSPWLLGAAVATALLLVFTFLGRRRGGIPTGRFTRRAIVSRLAASLAASWLGARLRRLFAGKKRRARLDRARREADARRLAETMGNMKGAIMKLGQMVSFISDDVPEEYRRALEGLRAEAPAMDFPLIRDVVESELGRPLERAFARFDDEPLAAASIGQVHRALLPSGEEVVVKVQYPGVAEAIRADLDSADLIYRFLSLVYPKLDPRAVVEELRDRLGEELDYVREAKNQQAFAELYEGHPFIRIPRVFPAHATGRILTQEYVAGRRFETALDLSQEERDRYGEILYRFVFGSTSRFRVFNGDPHPGNYLLDDSGRIVFLDFGLTKYFPPRMIKTWRKALVAHIRGERGRFREQLVALGFLEGSSDITEDLLYDYFAYFYEPWREDRHFTFSRAYNKKSFGMVFRPEGSFAGMQKKMNMPRDFVFVNRIQWGVISILASLGASGNWHRIHREFILSDPPATDMGEEIAAWRARWLEARGLAGKDVYLTPAGLATEEPDGLPPILSV